ncbi:MAG: DNA cytosine methyltransferase [Gaiellaceae bacterium]
MTPQRREQPIASRPRVAEFFAGMGLVRLAVEDAGFRVVWANDIDNSKRDLYAAHFGERDFIWGDVCDVHAPDVPTAEVATASFPCTDLSLAGNRAGLAGEESSMFWEFARILRELRDEGRPVPVCMLENVPSFATSHGGADIRAAVAELNDLGYWCDLLVVDARRFVPQSRPRLFVIGSLDRLTEYGDWTPSELRPEWITRFVARHPELRMQALPLRLPPTEARTLGHVVQKLRPADPRWWDEHRLGRFVSSLSDVQSKRLAAMRDASRLVWATAYRRTRYGRAVWEIRADEISGCLRTARGGSSKQALVEAGRGRVRVRWMTPREYARLQGVPESYALDAVTLNKALFALGDAVCVPVVSWVAREYLRPLAERRLTASVDAVAYVG